MPNPRQEQLRCAADFHCPGARLGMHDWFAEEFIVDEAERDLVAAMVRVGGWRYDMTPERLRRLREDLREALRALEVIL